jgi:hypothetical protein
MRRLRVFRYSTAFCLYAYGWVVQRHVSFAAPRYMWCARACFVVLRAGGGVHDPRRAILFREFQELLVRIAKAKFEGIEPEALPQQLKPSTQDLHGLHGTRGGFCCVQPLWRRCVCWGVVAQVTICQRWMRLCLVCSGALMQRWAVDVVLVCLLAQAHPLRICLPLPHWLPPRLSRPQAAPNTYPPPR